MPRRSDVATAAAPTPAATNEKSPKGKAAKQSTAPVTAQPTEIIDVAPEDLVVKCDHATTVVIPEDMDQPYCCLDSVLMHATLYEAPQKFYYHKTRELVRLRALQVLHLQDGREALYLYTQDYDILTSQQKGKYLVVMHLPLKLRASSYKTETDAYYWGKQELLNLKAVSKEPALDTPDLDAFVKSYKPFKQFGIFSNLKELIGFYDMSVDARLKKCNTAGAARIDTYCREHLRQVSIIGQVRDQRSATLATNFLRLHRRLSLLSAPFETRFKVVSALGIPPKPTRETPPRGAKTAQAREEMLDKGPAAVAPSQAAVAAAPLADQFVAKKPPPRAALFGASTHAAPPSANKPKSRAELMQAMAARLPRGAAVGNAGKTSASKASAGAGSTERAVAAAASVPAAASAKKPAKAASEPELEEVADEAEMAEEEGVAEASPAPSAAKKKRAARGAPDPVQSPGQGKRARKQSQAVKDQEEQPAKYKNQGRKGMKYNTAKRQLEELKETLLPAAEAKGTSKSQELLRKLLGLPVGDEGPSSSKHGTPAAEMSEEAAQELKAEHAAEIEELKKQHDDELKEAHENFKERMQQNEAEAKAALADAQRELEELRKTTGAEIAKLAAKVEVLEQALADEKAEKESQFVRGWNVGFDKAMAQASTSGSKTRSSAHH